MSQRPLAVTAICVLGSLAALVTAVLFATNVPWAVPPSAGQRVLAFAAMAVTLTALFGMWRMRRWSVAVLGALLALRIAYGLAAALPWNPAALAGPALMLAVGLVYLRKMT